MHFGRRGKCHGRIAPIPLLPAAAARKEPVSETW
jgi:hypothetical protein